jgi:hypothetical protein
VKIAVHKKTANIIEFSVDGGPAQTLPVSILEKSKNKNQPLEIAIAQELGLNIKETIIAESHEVSAPTVSLADVKGMFATAGHEHPVTPHPHDFADKQHHHPEIVSPVLKLQEDVAKANNEITSLKRDLRLHDHDVPSHSHQSLSAEIGALRNDFGMLANRGMPEHSHGDLASIKQLADVVGQLNQAILDLRAYVKSRDEEITNAIPVMPQIPPQGVSEAEVIALIKDEFASRSSKTNVRLLSDQEVAGKKRFILEEL